MPALKVSINGRPMVTVSTDGLDILQVRVFGDRLGPHKGEVDVSGSAHPDDRESTHLTWVNLIPLTPGDRLEVEFLESGATSAPGKTLQELFPGEGPAEPEEFKPTEEVFRELAQRPKAFETIGLRFHSSSLGSFEGHTLPDEHGYSFSVLWNSFHPERARVSLHSFTLHSVQHREPGRSHVEGRIHYGDQVTFQIDADGAK